MLREAGQRLAVAVEHEEHVRGLVDLDRRRGLHHRWICSAEHVGDHDLIAGPEASALVQVRQQLRRHVMLLRQRFLDGFVVERFQLCPIGHVPWRRREGPGSVPLGDDVFGEQGRGVVLEGRPGGGVHLAGGGNAARRLIRGHHTPHVGTKAAVDLAGREPCVVKQDLGTNHRGASGALGKHRRFSRCIELVQRPGFLRVGGGSLGCGRCLGNAGCPRCTGCSERPSNQQELASGKAHNERYAGGRSNSVSAAPAAAVGERLVSARSTTEQGFGWAKFVGPIRQVMVRGIKKVDQLIVLTMTAYNLVRMRTLTEVRPLAP